MTSHHLTMLARLVLMPTLVLGPVAPQAAVLTFDINELKAERIGPFGAIFTTGEVVLCDGAIRGRRTGCGRDVAVGDIVTFTAVRMEGSYFQMKSAIESSDTDGVGEVAPPADVSEVLAPISGNVVYLMEQLGTFAYTPDDGEPGFIRLSSAFTSTFNITSDVPEPATWLLLITAFAGLVGARRPCCALRRASPTTS